jgi:anaerobic selenocysteine-containing dehydrogenase
MKLTVLFMSAQRIWRPPRFEEGPFCYMSPLDSEKLGITTNGEVEVSSVVGYIRCKAKVDAKGHSGHALSLRRAPNQQAFPT